MSTVIGFICGIFIGSVMGLLIGAVLALDHDQEKRDLENYERWQNKNKTGGGSGNHSEQNHNGA